MGIVKLSPGRMLNGRNRVPYFPLPYFLLLSGRMSPRASRQKLCLGAVDSEVSAQLSFSAFLQPLLAQRTSGTYIYSYPCLRVQRRPKKMPS